MFYVIVCPNCKTPRIIEDDVRNVTCFKCGSRLSTKRLKKYCRTSNIREAQIVLGFLNARRDGKEDEFISIFKE